MDKELSATLDLKRDELFFESLGSRPNTNLGQIFGLQGNSGDYNESLKYQAQKPSEPTAPKAKVTWVAELAKVVTAHKQGKDIGKVGVALLKSNEGTCKIILYRTKTKVLTTFTLNLAEQSCQLHRQSGYLQFYDDHRVYWCIYFDQEDEAQFVRKLQENGVKIRADSDDTLVKVPIVVPVVTQSKKSKSIDDQANKDEKFVDLGSQTSLSLRMSKIGEKLPALPAPRAKSLPYKQKNIQPPSTESSDDDKNENAGRMTSKAQLVSATSSGWLDAMKATSSTSNPMEAQFMQVLLSENRTQNTEMRINMGKLENKIEKILDKIQHIGAAPYPDESKKKAAEEDRILELEEKLLEVRKENRKLKEDLKTKLHEMEDKITYHLLFEYQRDFELLGITKADDLDDLITTLLKITTTTVGEMDKCITAKNDYMRQLEELQQQQSEDNKKIISLQVDVEALKDTKNQLQSNLSSKEIACTQLQEQLNKQKHPDVLIRQTEATIKTLMNNLYADLATKIEGLNTPKQQEIIAIIGRTIRDETLEAMKHLQQQATNGT